ncbi:vegetative incompatibility het-e-1 [Fusarium coicis]|nr:vegetative incompatibility het-e-1 [Fusarium coicis]
MTVTSPREAFLHRHQAVEPGLSNLSTEYPTIINTGGSTLCEQQFHRLRTAIIERNDTVAREIPTECAMGCQRRSCSRCRILNEAAHGGHLEVLKLLLDHGADISVKHLKGNTPLHEAADGMFWPEVVEEKYKPMGEILRRLQDDEGSLMDELNTERKSPRQIQSERRNKDNAAFESEEYTVGWVCALPLEMAAARGMLDLIHPDLSHQDPGDHNSYILGEIRGHNIVIACLPAGNYGTNPAATVAKDLLRTFKSIRFGLMVGIGGGAPSTQHDIRLGDVVISQPSGTLGGVVQHDRGKILAGGGFERTGSHNAPPQSLLSALARLQAAHMTEESKVPQFLSQLSAKAPKRMKGKFSYPGALHDRLYPAGYDHVKPESTTCAECDESRIIAREDRGDTDPYFHYGIIASGNQVIKDGKIRERLSQEYDALCFEMEAAGLYNFPCLVIRGICDYADSHKNKMWQEYAAATAAAFAKELLLFVPPNQVLQEKKLVSELVSIHNARYDSEDVKKSPRCEPGTRARIRELIHNWADQDLGLPLLWLIGPAGTGKSTLARSVIDALDIQKRLIAGYMFKRGEQDRNDTNRLFSTLAMQLVDTVPLFKESLRKSLEGLDKDAMEKTSLETQFQKLLWHPLENLQPEQTTDFPRIIVIDALDECERTENLQRLLRLFSKLCTSSALHLRVLITSRYAPEIVEAFEPLLQSKTVQTLDLHREFPEDTKSDIQKFLKARFAFIKHRRKVQREPWPTMEDLDRLVQLSTTPEPLFIYAATLCRFVSDKNRGPIQQLIMWLEQGSKSQLHQIYCPILDQAFAGFDEEEFLQKLRFLGTIVLLARPLSAKSLTLLLHTDLDDISWWVPRLYAVLHVPSELYQRIQLLHKSFSDFLTSDDLLGSNRYKINTADIHTNLAEACIQCMQAKLKQDICEIQKPGTTKAEIDANVINSSIPAELDYACNYWFLHLKRSDRSLSSFTYTFLFDHLLHWVEALSLLGRLADGVSILREVLEMSQTCNDLHQDFVTFVRDSIRVIVTFIAIIEVAPLQIYGSSIFFSPTGSIVRRMFWHNRIPKAGEIQGVEAHWSARLQVIQNSGTAVRLHVFSPNGRLLASAVESGLREYEIQLRNIITCTNLYTLSFTGSRVEAMTFSANDLFLAAADLDGYIKLWDVRSGHGQQIVIGCDIQLTAISFSSDLNLIISVSKNGKVQHWKRFENAYQEIISKCHNITENTNLRRLPHLIGCHMAEERLRWATFSPCMQLLAYRTTYNPRLQIWDFAAGTQKSPAIDRMYRPEFCSNGLLRFSPDSRLLVLVYGEVLTIWDVETGAQKLSLRHDHFVDAIAFSPCGTIIASSARERIQLWNLQTGVSRTTLIEDGTVCALAFTPDGSILASPQHLWGTKYHHSGRDSECITQIVASPDGQHIASASRDMAIRFWNAVTLVPQRMVRNTQDILELSVAPNGNLLGWLSRDQQLSIWRWHYGGAIQEEFPSSISDVAYSPDGQVVASAYWLEFGGEVALWEASTGRHLRILNGTRTSVKGTVTQPKGKIKARQLLAHHFATLSKADPELSQTLEFMSNTANNFSLVFSPDSQKVATVQSTGSLSLWDVSTGMQRHQFRIHSTVKEILFSPDGQLIAGLGQAEVFLWRITGSEPPKVLGVKAKTAEFFPDGNLLVVAGFGITVWDVTTGSRKHTLGDFEGSPMALCVSSDGRMIAVSSNSQFVRVWNVTSHPETHFTLRQKETVTTIAFSQDGKFLATASEHGPISIWDTYSGIQSRWAIRQEGLIRAIKFLPDELLVSVSDLPPFFNLWNDMKLRTHRYKIIDITTGKLLERVPYDAGLRYDGNWIMQGSENILWVPPQYRPTDGSVKAWVSQDTATIFIGSVSGHVIKFQCL